MLFNSIVYKNGSTHTIEDYADMAIRTASKRAYLMGEGNRRAEWGIRKVVVNSRIGACPRCGQYVGKVFIDDVYSGGSKADGSEPLLSEAIRGGLFHPRCKDSTSTYFEGITTLKPMTEEEMEEMDRREKEEARQAYHEREAEKNQRIADNSLDPDNKKTYAHRAEQQRKKAASVKKLQTEKSSVIDSWEAENYKNSTETGLLITSDGKIIDFGGTDHHVTGRADDIRLMDGAVFTHNHPTNNTFSQNDIVTGLVKGNLKELRAVTSTGDIHILVNNGATEEQRKKFSAAYQQRRMKAANAADSKIRKGEKINKEEYIRNRLEAFMSENAEDYNLKYVKSHIENNGRPLANSGESGIIKINNYRSVTECKNISEARQYFREKWNVEIDRTVDELDFESVRESLHGIESVLNGFPSAVDSLKRIGTSTEYGIMNADYDGNINFNPFYFKERKKAVYGCNSETHYHPTGNNIMSTGAHETGHILEKALIDKRLGGEQPIGNVFWNTGDEAKKIVKQACKNVKKTPHGKKKRNIDLIREISGYANKGGNSECLAEAVADFILNGDKAAPLSREIWKLLKGELV